MTKDGIRYEHCTKCHTLCNWLEMYNWRNSTVENCICKDCVIKELKDKVEMLDFFYESNGFKNRSLTNSVQIADYINKLEKENDELQEMYDTCLRENTGLKIHNAYVEKKLTEAERIIREVLKKTYGEGWNYSLDAKVRAENFLKGDTK